VEPIILNRNDHEFWQKLRFRCSPSSIFITPTDTVYGISTRIDNKNGIKRILKLKKRFNSNFIVLVPTIDEVLKLTNISAVQEIIVKRYWPGPISFVLPSKKCPAETICIRLPKDDFLLKLINFCACPIISTSCNKSAEEPVNSIEEATSLFGTDIDFYIDGGKIENKIVSTIVDLCQNIPQIIREGMVKFP